MLLFSPLFRFCNVSCRQLSFDGVPFTSKFALSYISAGWFLSFTISNMFNSVFLYQYNSGDSNRVGKGVHCSLTSKMACKLYIYNLTDIELRVTVHIIKGSFLKACP